MTTLKDRVLNILTSPRTEWPVIEAERTDVPTLYRSYIALLAAIPAVSSFIGTTVFGITLPLVGTIRTPAGMAFAHMIVAYVLSLAGVYVSALIVDKLAPTFESQPNDVQALKLVAYASTPTYVAGVLNIIPALGVLALLAALYAIYLFYLGLPVLMKTPEARVVPYMIVSALVILVVSIVFGTLAAALVGGASIATV